MAIRVSLTESVSIHSHNMEAGSGGLVCKPLKSLEEVEEFLRDPPVWRALCVKLKPHSDFAIRNMDVVRQNHPYHELVIGPERPANFCHSSPDLDDVVRRRRDDLPRTLVCHDMANGYHDDSKIDGTLNGDAYTFYNWAVVDIFCYFSHHFVTVPPPGWINTGHQHGVKVIGTVITEWAEGTVLWADILADPETFASSLVTIAKTLKFDGWLLNVENKVSSPDLLLQFVQNLHSLLHQELDDPVLIWYDSVTIEGNLHWQNGLNSRNKPFFDACDGIFTNYTWCEADVKISKVEAGARVRDVFVGIDVWGRNFLGGGHFNTQQAVKIVFEHGCSLAIFAPAWTHEAMADEAMKIRAPKQAPKIRLYRKFLLRDRALWGSLWPYLHTKLPCQLPFKTSFCRGQGKKRWLYGEVSSPDLLLQFVQNLHSLLHQELDDPVLIWYDSVTIEGNLHWQNGLNSRNKPFFDACDGIFTNYTWCEADVKISKVEAGARVRDVFVGIDVWGRNFLGGGHFNTQQAVKIVFEHGCSLAIFAPAWTHEAMADEAMKIRAPKQAPKIRLYRKFLLRDRALWGSLWPYLHTKLPCQLPFKTSFCRGQGKKRWLYGEVMGPSDWFNLRHQQYQPNAAHGAHGYVLAPEKLKPEPATALPPPTLTAHLDSPPDVTTLPTVQTAAPELNTSDESLERKRTLLQRIRDVFRIGAKRMDTDASQSIVRSSGKSMQNVSMSFQLGAKNPARYTLVYLPDELECIEVCHSDSFTGGSCVAINPCDGTNTEHRFVRLFHTDFTIQGTLIACIATKILPEDAGQYLNVILSVTDPQGSEHRVTLVGRNLPGSRGNATDTCQPLHPSDPEFKELQRYLLLNEPSFYVATENAFGWKVRYYSLPLRGRVTSVNVRTGLEVGPVLLGHFGLCQR